jgi:hypothetical protein
MDEFFWTTTHRPIPNPSHSNEFFLSYWAKGGYVFLIIVGIVLFSISVYDFKDYIPQRDCYIKTGQRRCNRITLFNIFFFVLGLVCIGVASSKLEKDRRLRQK